MNPAPGEAAPPPALDHLVVMADTLTEGVAWAEATLGVTPGPGGEHTQFGTHNRLLAIGGPGFALSYLEIIAINPEAVRARPAGAAGQNDPEPRRWFDMDDAALREQVRTHGPRLIHWVARVPDVLAATQALAAQGIDRGAVRPASRATPSGLLQWQITVRDDGQRLFGGCLPTLIQWGTVHPAATMADSGLCLHQLTLAHPQADALQAACRAAGLGALLKDGRLGMETASVAEVRATLLTPRGSVTLSSSAAP